MSAVLAEACGIDFGASNSTAGWSLAEQHALLPLEDGKLTLPSVIFFHAEDEHVRAMAAPHWPTTWRAMKGG